MTLPMILETGWFAIIFGALSAFAALFFLWVLVAKRTLAMVPAVLAFGAYGGWALSDALTWRTTLDDAGIRVRSASLEGARDEVLPWSEVRRVDVRRVGTKVRTMELMLAGAGGTTVAIVLDALPAGDVVPVVQLVLERAKGAERGRPAEELLALARQAEENMLLTRYRVTGGANR